MDEYTNLVKSPIQIIKNLKTLSDYKDSSDLSCREFHENLIVNGICFVLCQCNTELLVGPSKFVGYIDNEKTTYKNTTMIRDGKVATPKITELIGDLIQDGDYNYADMELLYRKYCKENKIRPQEKGYMGNKRKYWFIECKNEL